MRDCVTADGGGTQRREGGVVGGDGGYVPRDREDVEREGERCTYWYPLLTHGM
jgi:hypothetical protein